MSSLIELIRDLCQPATGVVAPGNRDLFERLQRELPFTLHEYPSGSEHNGWVVHDNWWVEKALLIEKGKVVFDGTKHTLGVARLSRSFTGTLSRSELDRHLVSLAAQPGAQLFHCNWQYRPWAADWALSLPHSVRETLGGGPFEVELVTHREPGSMTVAEYVHRGSSDATIVLNSNTCHPHMANDGFCGSAIFIRLLQRLREQKTHYTYRLVLGPEHLGSVFYLRDRSAREIANMVGGVFLEMAGTQGPLKATSTFLGNTVWDDLMHVALRDASSAFDRVPFRRGAGNDETVWEAPGYEVPFIELTRSRSLYEPFPEYHTSLDTPDLMDEPLLEETLAALEELVFILEHNIVATRLFTGLICLSNPRYDLYVERPDPSIEKTFAVDQDTWGYLQDCLPRYFDGRHSVAEIALEHSVPFRSLLDLIRRFEERGLVATEFVPLARPEDGRAAPGRGRR